MYSHSQTSASESAIEPVQVGGGVGEGPAVSTEAVYKSSLNTSNLIESSVLTIAGNSAGARVGVRVSGPRAPLKPKTAVLTNAGIRAV